jgi:methionine synthase II (cobalamin-independent)
MPGADHGKAARAVWKYTPDIPCWVQLPAYRQEGMIQQFLPGLPGWSASENGAIDAEDSSFSDHLLVFYQEYMDVLESRLDINDSRFALSPETVPGFYHLLRDLPAASPSPKAVKGQITGPVTFTTSIRQSDDRAIFHDERLRDAAICLLSLKARWQVRRLFSAGLPVILFLDEPAMAGFGSSEMISVTGDAVAAAWNDMVQAIHTEGGLAGIHVCANTDWNLVLDSGVDIVNFDSYGYFDRFILYPHALKSFWDRGGMIAWGIVPTDPSGIDRETSESLARLWESQAVQLQRQGISRSDLVQRSFLTPACGLGSLNIPQAERVLVLLHEVSGIIREKSES